MVSSLEHLLGPDVSDMILLETSALIRNENPGWSGDMSTNEFNLLVDRLISWHTGRSEFEECKSLMDRKL
jgi:hypothetical protein